MPAYKDEKRNTWYAMFYYTDWQGVRRRKKKRGFKRKKDAQDYERDFLNKEQRDCNITFKNLVEEYFEDMETRLKTTTISNKKFLFDSKITPYFEKMAACKITAKSIREWQNELLKMNYSPTYLKTINNQLSAVFNYAVKYYGLSSNPCRQAGSMGKKDADSMQIWTLDEFNKFISFVTKPAAHLAFEILFWTGIRSGELLALTPEDILPDKKISINKTYARLDGEDIISEPKTPKSIRIIPIPDFLYDEIWDYINRLGSIEKTDRIFYFSKGFLNNEIKRVSKKAGVKEIRVHDLRHSHASLLIEMGYSILLVSERLGHEKVETTLNTYAHLYPNKQQKLVEGLQNLKIDPQ